MSAGQGRGGRGSGELAEGHVVGGNVLHSPVSASEFCSIWLTDQVKDAKGPCCIRVIPEASLLTRDARRRLRQELEFWQHLSTPSVVGLYQCGWDPGYCFTLMQHMPDGSLADQYEPGRWEGDDLANMALAFADALRDIHSATGPHGNLKPSNVFALADGGVCVSDFLLPLWLDELAAGSIISTHLQHPYRAPEQRKDPRDYDTRSDVYSFGLVLLQCLTGAVPLLGENDPNDVTAEWPQDLAPIVRRCLLADPDKRYADGPELYDALIRAGTRRAAAEAQQPPAAEEQAPAPEQAPATDAGDRVESVWLEWDEKETARRVDQAAELVRQGRLETALELVESLPPDAPGVAKIVDEIEHRDQVSEDLANEAARLAETGDITGALGAIEEAEQLFPKGDAVQAVKASLVAARDRQVVTPPGAIPAALEEALAGERYELARSLLEKQIHAGEMTPELAAQVRRFKRGRARKGYLENVRSARHAYLRGDRTGSAQRWLEAARWLAPGPDRAHLRNIARAAAGGTLRLDVGALATAAQAAAASQASQAAKAAQAAQAAQAAPPAMAPQAAYAAPPAAQQGAAAGGPATLPQVPAIVQEKLDAAARLAAEGDRRRLLILLGVLAVLLIAFLALMWAIFGH